MTQEEFAQKIAGDKGFQKVFKADPMKVLQENNVELSQEDLEKISGGDGFDWEGYGDMILKIIKENIRRTGNPFT